MLPRPTNLNFASYQQPVTVSPVRGDTIHTIDIRLMCRRNNIGGDIVAGVTCGTIVRNFDMRIRKLLFTLNDEHNRTLWRKIYELEGDFSILHYA